MWGKTKWHQMSSCFWTCYRHYMLYIYLTYKLSVIINTFLIHTSEMPDYLDPLFFFVINALPSPCVELPIWKSRYLLSIRVPVLNVIDQHVVLAKYRKQELEMHSFLTPKYNQMLINYWIIYAILYGSFYITKCICRWQSKTF